MTHASPATEQADKELRERFTKFCGSLGYTGPATEETARGFDAVLAFVKEELSRAGGERTQVGHTAAEISAAVLTEARAKAREDGRDVEVTVLAMQLACAEVATLRRQLAAVEAARAKAMEGADKYFAQSEQSLREEAAALEKSNPGFGGRARDVLVELDRRAAVIESLRASLATAQDEAQREKAELAPFKDWPTVLQFARVMVEKLEANKHKGGWDTCDVSWLLKRLREETAELVKACEKHDPDGVTPDERATMEITSEAADVANFAMMVADNCGLADLDRKRGAR